MGQARRLRWRSRSCPTAGVSKADIDKYLAALRRAQVEIDLHPEAYKHYHLRAVPE